MNYLKTVRFALSVSYSLVILAKTYIPGAVDTIKSQFLRLIIVIIIIFSSH